MGIGTNHIVLFLAMFAALCVPASAQSGRTKPGPTPSPTPLAPPPVVYNPTDSKPSPKPDDPKKAEDQEVIRVESGLVPLPVSVTDKEGRPVAGLERDNFSLEIDGQPVTVGEVSRAQSPVRLVLMFDNSSSVAIAREFEKRAAIRFLQTVIRPEKDLAALYSVSTVSRLEQTFTRNVATLIAAIDQFPQPIGLTALLDGLVSAGEYLKTANGRRVIVVVSDGEDTGSETGFDETVRRLQISNAQVFIVKTTDFENFKRTQSRQGSANLKQLAAEKRMQEIARQTGGAVYSPLDDAELDAAFTKIAEEISDQYLVAYYPDNDKDKSFKFRSVKLTVKNRPDLVVRTRVGYYGPF